MIVSISNDVAKSNLMRVVIREDTIKMPLKRLIQQGGSKHLFMPGVVAVVSYGLCKLFIYAVHGDTDTYFP